jgi:hypothetical protein
MKNIPNEFLDHFCTFEMDHYAYLVVWIFVYHFFFKKNYVVVENHSNKYRHVLSFF